MAGSRMEGERKVEGVPSGTEALLGFPCPAGRSVGYLAHAGDVGFRGREITSVGKQLAICSNLFVLYVNDEGRSREAAYPEEPAPSCSLSAILCNVS